MISFIKEKSSGYSARIHFSVLPYLVAYGVISADLFQINSRNNNSATVTLFLDCHRIILKRQTLKKTENACQS